jgi:hypothetical protein
MVVRGLADALPRRASEPDARCAELAKERSALTIVPARLEPREGFEVRSWPMN